MYLLGREVTIEWVLNPSDNPLPREDYDVLLLDPEGLSTYSDSPIDLSDYTAPTSTEKGKIIYRVSPQLEGLWRVRLTTGTSTEYRILSKIEMYVFCPSKIVGMEFGDFESCSTNGNTCGFELVNLSLGEGPSIFRGYRLYETTNLIDDFVEHPKFGDNEEPICELPEQPFSVDFKYLGVVNNGWWNVVFSSNNDDITTGYPALILNEPGNGDYPVSRISGGMAFLADPDADGYTSWSYSAFLHLYFGIQDVDSVPDGAANLMCRVYASASKEFKRYIEIPFTITNNVLTNTHPNLFDDDRGSSIIRPEPYEFYGEYNSDNEISIEPHSWTDSNGDSVPGDIPESLRIALLQAHIQLS